MQRARWKPKKGVQPMNTPTPTAAAWRPGESAAVRSL